MTSRSELEGASRTFVPPAGLNRSTPREVRLTGAGRVVFVVGLLLLAGAVAVTVILSGTATRQAGERAAFLGNHTTITGEVVRLSREGKSKERWVSYRFVAGSDLYQGRGKVSAARWNALRVGAPIAVSYVPSDPRINVLAGLTPGAIPPWLAYVVSGALAGLGGLCLLLVVAQRRLVSEGRAAPGIVTKHYKHHTSHGGTHRYMTYEYRLLGGAVMKGKGSTSSKPPAIGSVICVLYDPDRPQRSSPYPVPLARPAIQRNL